MINIVKKCTNIVKHYIFPSINKFLLNTNRVQITVPLLVSNKMLKGKRHLRKREKIDTLTNFPKVMKFIRWDRN